MSESITYLKSRDQVLEEWGEDYAELADLLDLPYIRFTSDGQIEVTLTRPVKTDEGEETKTPKLRRPVLADLKYAGTKHPNPVSMQAALIERIGGLNGASLDSLDLKNAMRLTSVGDCFL